jgi:NTP pyrophosphatase (non-canonical NTP hydrolase)
MALRHLQKCVEAEIKSADERYGPFRSTHEGFGVLAEEVAELLDAIRRNDGKAIEKEAIQVSAVALRIAWSLGVPETAGRSNL